VEEWALSQLGLFWIVPIVGTAATAFLYARLGAEDSANDRAEVARHAALEPGELSLAGRELTGTSISDAFGHAARGREGGRNRPCDCPA
jgi:hypothetical protein